MTTTTTQVKRTTLDIQAEGLNEINNYTLALVSFLLPQFKQYIGTKILRADGKEAAKFNIDEFVKENYKEDGKHISYNYYFSYTGCSVWMKVRVCINGGSYDVRPTTAYCQYFEKDIYMGTTSDLILTKVSDPATTIVDYKLLEGYTAPELRELINDFEAKRQAANEAYNKIPDCVREATHTHIPYFKKLK